MIVRTWRLDMRLKSPQMLRQYMEYRRLNVRQLARSAGVARATIGHLHSGARSTCKTVTALAIEEALQAPPGLLFDPSVSSVAREAHRASESPKRVA